MIALKFRRHLALCVIPFVAVFADVQRQESQASQAPLCWESAECGLNRQAVDTLSYVVDSTLLPLTVTKTSYPQHFANHHPGMITAIYGKLILSDSSGHMSFIEGDEFHETGLPHIPKQQVTVRDIKFSEHSNALFACFHYVDEMDGTHHTSIAQLVLNRQKSISELQWAFVYDSNHHEVAADNCVLEVSNNSIYFLIGSLKDGPSQKPYAQDPDHSFGKSYELDLASGKTTLLGSGHRMSLGMTQRRNGYIWFTENGERGGDKLSYLMPGQTHGWPLKISGTRYFHFPSSISNSAASKDAPPVQSRFTEATYTWLPSIAPSAIIELQGFHPQWDGDLLVGSLKAQSLYRVRLLDNQHVHSIEQIHIGQRIRGIQQLGQELYLTTDEGVLVKLSVDEARLHADSALPNIPGGEALGLCINCHSFTGADVTSNFGPALNGVFGKGIASQNFAYFSSALKKKAGVWDEANMTAYLLDPSAYAPGTTMKIGVKLTPEQVSRIVQVLKTLR